MAANLELSSDLRVIIGSDFGCAVFSATNGGPTSCIKLTGTVLLAAEWQSITMAYCQVYCTSLES
jgi:hypothetical protein